MLSAPLGIFHLGKTKDCNMACVHCYNSEEREKTEKEEILSTEQTFDFLEQSYSMGLFFMKLQGGEPVFCKDWEKIAEKSINLGMATTLYTGGYFKGKTKTLEEVAEMPFSEIRLTFAGLKDIHDKLRPAKPVRYGIGQPSYEDIIKTLDYLLERKANVKLNFVLGKNNMHQVKEFVEVMAEKSEKYGKPFEINFGPQRPFGEGFSCPGDNGKNLMTAEEFYKINELVETLRENSKIKDAGMNLIVVFDILSKRKDYPSAPKVMQRDGCGLGKKGFCINYTGEIGICSFMNACGLLPSGGNIKEQTLEELWFESPLLNKGRSHEKEQCNSCEYYTRQCQGICPAMALYTVMVTMGKPRSRECIAFSASRRIIKKTLSHYAQYVKLIFK